MLSTSAQSAGRNGTDDSRGSLASWTGPGLALPWLLLCLALAIHVADEALTGFLVVYNPTVEELRTRLGWWPTPTFTFTSWLVGLITLCVILVLVTPWVARGSPMARATAAIFAVLMLLNAAAHTLGTLLGHTTAAITFERPMPGFWSSPLLAVAAVWMLLRLAKPSKKQRARV